MPDLADIIGSILADAMRLHELHGRVIDAKSLGEAKALTREAGESVAAIVRAASDAAEELGKRARRYR
jgi:hypothetical protein